MGIGAAHLCGAIPNNDYYEQLVLSTEQIKNLKNLQSLPIVEGYLTVPDQPGLGPEPDWKRLEKTAIAVV